MSDTTNNGGKRIEKVKLDSIMIDRALQMRERPNEETIEDYAEAMKAGATFPPVIVFEAPDGRLWLSDGFHRFEAARRVGLREIAAEVRQGTRRDALLAAAGANAHHGLRRSRADKRKAVLAVLDEPESGDWSNRRIAEVCNVTEFLVRTLKAEAEGAINRTLGSATGLAPSTEPPGETRQKPVSAGTMPRATSIAEARRSAPTGTPRPMRPPPGAGDAWEPPLPGSEEAQQDAEARRAAAVKRDMVGNPLPAHLHHVFADTLYGDLVALLKRAARAVRGDPAGGIYMRLRQYPTGDSGPILAMMEDLAELLDQWQPHAVCTTCGGKGCADCENQGWLSQCQHFELEQALKLLKPRDDND